MRKSRSFTPFNTNDSAVVSEEEREANIARNRALLAQLDVTLDIPKPVVKEKTKAKPVQLAKKRVKREEKLVLPVRQSTRLRRGAPDPNETPEKKRKREVRCYIIDGVLELTSYISMDANSKTRSCSVKNWSRRD